MNLELFSSGKQSQRYLGEVPIGKLSKSPQNPRQTYDEKRVAQLADHIKATGYDVTRAVKVHRGAKGALLVFAGSTRVEAAKRAGLKAIPAFEFVGYTDAEIWRFAYDDNEADGKHTTLPITDVWADYAARAVAGMTQEQIAEALGVSQALVSYRIRFDALPKRIKEACINGGHLSEYALTQTAPLIKALIPPLAPWLTGDALLEHVALACIERKADEAERKKLVERAKKTAALAGEAYERLPAEPAEAFKVVALDKPAKPYEWDLRADFVKRLAKSKARLQSDVQKVIDDLEEDRRKSAAAYAEWLKAQADAASLEAAKEAERRAEDERRKRLAPVVIIGSCLEGMPEVADGEVDLVIADPPYGAMTAERETVRSGKARPNDLAPWDEELSDPAKLDEFNSHWIPVAARKLKPSGSMYVCGTRHNLGSILTQLPRAGLEILNLIAWYKPNSTPTFLVDRFAFATEYLVLARKGSSHYFDADAARSYTSTVAPTKQAEDAQLRDVWVIPVCGGDERVRIGGKAAHPTQKPIALYGMLARISCPPGGLILDPFAGSGTTAVVAMRQEKRSLLYEIDVSMFDVITGRVEDARV